MSVIGGAVFAPHPRNSVEIEGQSGLRVFGYPHQALLRQNTRSMMVGPGIDDSLTSLIEILVPTLPAYVTGKVLSSKHRTQPPKQAAAGTPADTAVSFSASWTPPLSLTMEASTKPGQLHY